MSSDRYTAEIGCRPTDQPRRLAVSTASITSTICSRRGDETRGEEARERGVLAPGELVEHLHA